MAANISVLIPPEVHSMSACQLQTLLGRIPIDRANGKPVPQAYEDQIFRLWQRKLGELLADNIKR